MREERPAATPLALVAGMSGNLMEWYDFALYGVLASTLGGLFFPMEDRLLSLLSVFGVFAAGYLMRLLGGAAFGHVADRFSRRRALLVSAGAMAVSTALVGCLPTYAGAGAIAPVLFTLLRLLQGISIGGEFTTSVSYLIETAPPQRRALQGSLAAMTAGAGIVLGSAMGNALFSIYDVEEIRAWAWRLPFLVAIPLGLSVVILRCALPVETLASGSRPDAPSPVSEVLRRPREIVRGILLGWGPTASFYVVAVFLGSFAAAEHLLPLPSALGLQTASIALMVLVTPLAGHLADRVGRRAVVVWSMVACALGAFPLFLVLRGADPTREGLAELAYAVILTGGLVPFQVWLAELFPRAVRTSGLGLAYNGAAGILGGSAPLLCTTLAQWTGSELAPAGYLALACAVSALVAFRTEETKDQPLA